MTLPQPACGLVQTVGLLAETREQTTGRQGSQPGDIEHTEPFEHRAEPRRDPQPVEPHRVGSTPFLLGRRQDPQPATDPGQGMAAEAVEADDCSDDEALGLQACAQLSPPDPQ